MRPCVRQWSGQCQCLIENKSTEIMYSGVSRKISLTIITTACWSHCMREREGERQNYIDSEEKTDSQQQQKKKLWCDPRAERERNKSSYSLPNGSFNIQMGWGIFMRTIVLEKNVRTCQCWIVNIHRISVLHRIQPKQLTFFFLRSNHSFVFVYTCQNTW